MFLHVRSGSHVAFDHDSCLHALFWCSPTILYSYRFHMWHQSSSGDTDGGASDVHFYQTVYEEKEALFC